MINIEPAISTTNNKSSVYEWLINQDHVPFDMSSDAHGTHYQLYHEFLKDINELYHKTGATYFWYTRGKLHHSDFTESFPPPGDSVKVDKNKLRDLKLIELLS
jgi:hypothetical protein